MGTETLMVLVAVGALAGWALIVFADGGRLHEDDDPEITSFERRAQDDPSEHHLVGLATLGLSRETCVWIHETMRQGRSSGTEGRAIL